jgi:uncharacterized hydrophobic protein (TIGR00341 family)
LIEIVLPKAYDLDAEELLREKVLVEMWREQLLDNRVSLKVLIATEKAESVLDVLEQHFAGEEGYRIIVHPVSATLPRWQHGERDELESVEKARRPLRISREEIYSQVSQSIRLTPVFVTLVAISTIVASVGLLTDSVAVIIGAMVLAPLLGPNVALALATTLGDVVLARRAFLSNAAGVLTAFLLSVGIGALVHARPDVPEIASRTRVETGHVVLALASGVACSLSVTSGAPAALIGVMVAVALLPPLAVFGMLLGANHKAPAVGALLLVVTNVICVNLAAVVTFLMQGIRPASWWEAGRARVATRIAVILWASLLAALVLAIRAAHKG